MYRGKVRRGTLESVDPTAFMHGILAEVLYVGVLGSLAFVALEAARWLGR